MNSEPLNSLSDQTTSGSVTPSGDELLQNVSPVLNPSTDTDRERLSKSIEAPLGKLQVELDRVSKENSGSLEHIEHLKCSMEDLRAVRLAESTCNNFLSLSQLKHLELFWIDIGLSPEEIGLFPAFKLTLSHITLDHCSISKSALVSLMNYFPNLKSLSLIHPRRLDSNEDTPFSPRGPLETLFVGERCKGWSEEPLWSLELLDHLSKRGLCSDEIAFGPRGRGDRWTVFAGRVISIFGASVKHLKLPVIPSQLHPLNLSSCHELRELELNSPAYPLLDRELDLIPTVTSVNIEKITINRFDLENQQVENNATWERFDGILTELAKLPREENRLEVEFRYLCADDSGEVDQEPCLSNYLPEFVQKGQVTVRNKRNQLVHYDGGHLENVVVVER